MIAGEIMDIFKTALPRFALRFALGKRIRIVDITTYIFNLLRFSGISSNKNFTS
jgi:hypothetical protein